MKLRWGYYRCLEEKTERSIGSESIFNAQRHFPKLINYILGNDIGIGLKKLRSTNVLSYLCFIKYQWKLRTISNAPT